MKRRNRLSRKWWTIAGLYLLCAASNPPLRAQGAAGGASTSQGQSGPLLREEATTLQDKGNGNEGLAQGYRDAASVEKKEGHPQQAQIDQMRATHLEKKGKAEDAQALKDMREAHEVKDHPVAGGQGSAGAKGTGLTGSAHPGETPAGVKTGGGAGVLGSGAGAAGGSRGGGVPGWAERARAEGLQQNAQERMVRAQADNEMARYEASQGHMNQAQLYKDQAKYQEERAHQDSRQAVRDWNRSEGGGSAAGHPHLGGDSAAPERPHLSGGMSQHPHLSGGMREHPHLDSSRVGGEHPHLHSGGSGMGRMHTAHPHASHVHAAHVHSSPHVHAAGRR
ncbi:MAG: hypothetical protein AB7T14_00775 [Candidatus Methylacidiphilaceae bacterium]